MPSYDKRYPRQLWNARIRMYGRSVFLGYFATRGEAITREEQVRRVYHQKLVAEGLDTYHRKPRVS